MRTERLFRSALDGDTGTTSFSLRFRCASFPLSFALSPSPSPSSFPSHFFYLIDNKPLQDCAVRSRMQFQLNYAEFEGPIVRYAKSFACRLNVRADAVGADGGGGGGSNNVLSARMLQWLTSGGSDREYRRIAFAIGSIVEEQVRGSRERETLFVSGFRFLCPPFVCTLVFRNSQRIP